jgi:hypothetical protein
MKRRILLVSTTVVLSVLLLAAASPIRLVDRWTDPGFEKKKFDKLAVIGIAADEEIRKRFEDKCVSHLRGRGIGGVTSYSLVPDLSSPGNANEIMDRVMDQGIDGAITFRLVDLGGADEDEWAAAWRDAADDEQTLRTYVTNALPVVMGDKKTRYGVEVTLWQTPSRYRVWTGRTGTHTRKQLSKQAGAFVQLVMDKLKDDRLL